MPGLLDGPQAAPIEIEAPAGDRLARRDLQRQIERLERDLAGLSASAWERRVPDWPPPAAAPAARRPRVRNLAELERVRDGLVGKAQAARAALDERAVVEADNRRLLREMLRDPRGHRWMRVRSVDVGEPGCRNWHVLPRFGPIGMMLDWWRVRISSGCP